jgi:phosphoribosyl 1,2-cyclic phosphodiesterase
MQINKNIAHIISSGSHGNAVLYHSRILVDIGVPFNHIEPYKNNIQIILLTHKHSDHINISSLNKLISERPSIRIGCSEAVERYLLLNGIIKPKNIDVYVSGEIYDYSYFKISAIDLYHDVPCIGFRIFKNGYKIIHATDTAHLNGIEAKNYDLYAIEHNYDADTIENSIAYKKSIGEYSHQEGSMNTHLSEQQAKQFIYNNRKPESKVLRLHESKSL